MVDDYSSMLQSELQHASAGRALLLLAMETMGDRIRQLRVARELTQEQLAERLNARGAQCTGNAVSQWERGDTENIKLKNFLALVDELWTTHDYLVHGPSDPTRRDSTGKFRRLRPVGGSGSKA